MSYTTEQKKQFLMILVSKDFDIKNSVIQYNEKFNTGLDRGTVYNWIKDDELFKQEYELLKFELLDEAEKMHQLLRRGIPIKDESNNIIAWQEKPDRAAIEFFLKCKGRERGYIEKTDIINQTEITLKKDLPSGFNELSIDEQDAIIATLRKLEGC
jgi:hypothetical protein